MRIGLMGLIGLIGLMMVSCEKPASDNGLAKAQLKIMKKMASERDHFEAYNKRLEARVMELEGQLHRAENRLEIAKDSSKFYENLLHDSNAAKLARARELMREIEGK